MGKRITNAFARDKGQASAGSQEQEDDPNKPPGTVTNKINIKLSQRKYFKDFKNRFPCIVISSAVVPSLKSLHLAI